MNTYIIVDLESNLVLAQTTTWPVARLTCNGLVNGEIEVHHPKVPIGDEKVINNIHSVRIMDNATGEIISYDDVLHEEIDDRFFKLREITSLKLHFIEKIYLNMSAYASRSTMDTDTGIFHWLGHAIDHSQIEKSIIHPSIIEYADINEISPEQAYYHLKMVHDTFQSIHVKAFAYLEKYSKLINMASSESQMSEILSDLLKRLHYDATI